MKQHLKAIIVVVIFAALGVWGFNQWMASRTADTNANNYTALERMEKEGVPSFEAKDLSGQTFELSSMEGKVVILNFWASWCGPCIEEVPSLIKLVKEFKGEVQLIAISGDSLREDIDVFMKSFPEMKGENIKIVWDQDRSLMKQFQVARLPESMVLGKDQKLVKKIVGTIDWYNKDSIAYIKSLLEK
ncbi:MAG: thiol:disulfide interchange protein tlpA [Bdellovibrio sp. ArHS]|uniref:TlpA family protein disulfide reductase n=1 Tax=Bdellovibrio sp. ArHS TaxID=1569284 RepID=UPI00058391FF|nr:TlpA disulfide reductase family protein [Bdellovibrio sp. ArHS]KHD87570.1 MAG: thiol:disulfide interchange protein tlpA [Bdellovibrio sp. ArHS]